MVMDTMIMGMVITVMVIMAKPNIKRWPMRRSFSGLALAAAALFSMTAHAHSGHDGHQHHHHAHDHEHHGHESRSFPDPATVPAPDGVSVKACWIRALPSRLPAAAYFQL